MKVKLKILTWTTWTILSLLLITSLLTDIEITNEIAKRGLVFVFILGQVKLLTLKQSWTWTKYLFISITAFGLFMTLNIYSDWRYEWQTAVILFKHKHVASRTIEHQVQKKGPETYNTRVVDRLKLFYFISWTKILADKDLTQTDLLTWDKVERKYEDKFE